MSYDHWLYRGEPDAGPLNEWDHNRFVSLGSLADVEALLHTMFVQVSRREQMNKPYWHVSDDTTRASYDVHPNLAGDGSVSYLIFRGMSDEAALTLARGWNMAAYNPQRGEEYR